MSTLDIFLNDEHEIASTGANFKASLNTKKSSRDIFPVSVFTRKGAKVIDRGNGTFLVNFRAGKYTASKITEKYIYSVLTGEEDFSDDMINAGVPLWCVKEISNGKFIIKRATV